MKEKIKFGDLSLPLKIVVVFSWVLLVIYTFAFFVGFASVFV